MKQLDQIFRSMKRIAPTSEYAAWSRASILSHEPVVPAQRITLAALLRGAGVAAMATLAFVGGISVARLMMPTENQVAVQPSSRQALRAEAQTVETQLALADVQHQVVADAGSAGITPAATRLAKSAAGASADTAVDRALDALAQ